MEDILEVLDSSSPNEITISKGLREQAHELLTSSATNSSTTPKTLGTLLTTILKPLFSKSQHHNLTSTGRKNLLTDQPVLPSRFDSTADSIFGPAPPWKTHWTVPLLDYILAEHDTLSLPVSSKRQILEANFHLLVPPLLHLIDESDAEWKAHGCDLLAKLCVLLYKIESDILRRTGLTEVFIEALASCFHYLPSLTPEEESLLVLRAMYPAYLGLVRARFGMLERMMVGRAVTTTGDDEPQKVNQNQTTTKKEKKQIHQQEQKEEGEVEEIITIIPSSKKTTIKARPPPPTITTTTRQPKLQPPPSILSATQISSETTQRTAHLSRLLRHSLQHSISHLSTSTPNSPASTTSIPLTTFFLSQIYPIISQMHIYASVHLQSLLPMVCGIIRDPFATTAAPGMVDVAIDAVEGLVQVCWVRVRERWWVEILGAVVEAWLNLRDDIGGMLGGRDMQRKEVMKGLMARLEGVVMLLGDVVGKEEFGKVVERLVREEKNLNGLFDTHETIERVRGEESEV